MNVASERELLGIALELGAREIRGWSPAESRLVRGLSRPAGDAVLRFRTAIGAGGADPLGSELCRLRDASARRALGATYTPAPIVDAMIEWSAGRGEPARVVDPGAGSGRYLVAAGRRFKSAALVGVEIDPVAAVLARGHLAAAGLAERAWVVVEDYRSADLGTAPGPTLFVGNPPYVRHHGIEPRWKKWLTDEAKRRGFRASQLAGLHVHFLLATLARARPGDRGTFITAAEWLDVNYGSLVRELFVGPLGGRAIVVVEPTATPFPGTATTAAIVCFELGHAPSAVHLRRVASLERLAPLESGPSVPRERLGTAHRWSDLTRRARRRPAGLVELGELCRVHRGQVTGANRVWIADAEDRGLPPSVLWPTVTRARELFAAGRSLDAGAPLRSVIDLPLDLGTLDPEERRAVERFLRRARALGADQGFVANHRRAWWAVGLRPPAPILATYMARRPPAFVRNRAGARHLNIAHGLYPRVPLDDAALSQLADWLAGATRVSEGRTYAHGLTKFEPREMERLLVPAPGGLP